MSRTYIIGRGRCPKCGMEGTIVIRSRNSKLYVYARHGRVWHYVGPLEKINMEALIDRKRGNINEVVEKRNLINTRRRVIIDRVLLALALSLAIVIVIIGAMQLLINGNNNVDVHQGESITGDGLGSLSSGLSCAVAGYGMMNLELCHYKIGICMVDLE
ncbi:hypothetical protein [Caldivirga sp. MU80]|jgi:hypothetical protein|uniref:hypothetical protein n=1 Tax=Caldivirga sp. MU80 TaxID=1650354 RepID=UPI00082F86F4|nr:hypothetical protein [Caldivirga sp. MU80]